MCHDIPFAMPYLSLSIRAVTTPSLSAALRQEQYPGSDEIWKQQAG
jgi:hypothetical protein